MGDSLPIAHTREPRASDTPEPTRDPDVLAAYLEDASGRPPGRAAGLLRPVSADELGAWLRATNGTATRVLPQAARSSLTGGAVPQGEVVVSVERLGDIGSVRHHGKRGRIRVGGGVRLRTLQDRLAEDGWYFPPVPTYQEAMVAGAVSTNAGGAATFKYGTVRSWVHGLTVVLSTGDVLELDRGEVVVPRGRSFEIVPPNGAPIRVAAPDWSLPDVPKISAGYHSAAAIDLVDLFVGSEGTLGIIVEADLEVVRSPPAVLTAVAFLDASAAALALTNELRDKAIEHRSESASTGVDVRAIEYVDTRGLALLRRHGDLARVRVDVPGSAAAAVLLEIELPEPSSTERTLAELEAWIAGDDSPQPGPLAEAVRVWFDVLERHEALDSLQIAFPDDPSRRDSLIAFREAVPTRVNELLAERRREDATVRKVGGDMIVPFERLGALLDAFGPAFERRGLEWAVWGHLSDGNLHPNALPRSGDEVRAGEDALLELADEVIRLGGSPLSEHGVGRSALKQEMLRRLLGDAAIDRMRAIKRKLDPEARLALGVLFEP